MNGVAKRPLCRIKFTYPDHSDRLLFALAACQVKSKPNQQNCKMRYELLHLI